MTIAVAVKTASATVFAADSRCTTRPDSGPAGSRRPYDTATKLACDRSGTLMAMVVGDSRIGEVEAAAHIAAYEWPTLDDDAKQVQELEGFVKLLRTADGAFWDQRPDHERARREGTTLVLAIQRVSDRRPAIWKAEFGPGAGSQPLLTAIDQRVWFDGSAEHVAALLLGTSPEPLAAIATRLNQVVPDLTAEMLCNAADQLRTTQDNAVPLYRLAVDHMPVQDAVDLAVFLAEAQVTMERFLPAMEITPGGDIYWRQTCGGPIDALVLQPWPAKVVSLPGKRLHHPRERVVAT